MSVRHCRIRTFDVEHKERGYCDFEVVNYDKFKNTFLQKPMFTLVNNQHGIEMVELRDPKFNVRVYFPNVKF